MAQLTKAAIMDAFVRLLERAQRLFFHGTRRILEENSS